MKKYIDNIPDILGLGLRVLLFLPSLAWLLFDVLLEAIRCALEAVLEKSDDLHTRFNRTLNTLTRPRLFDEYVDHYRQNQRLQEQLCLSEAQRDWLQQELELVRKATDKPVSPAADSPQQQN